MNIPFPAFLAASALRLWLPRPRLCSLLFCSIAAFSLWPSSGSFSLEVFSTGGLLFSMTAFSTRGVSSFSQDAFSAGGLFFGMEVFLKGGLPLGGPLRGCRVVFPPLRWTYSSLCLIRYASLAREISGFSTKSWYRLTRGLVSKN